MQCPRCGLQNQPGITACARCGLPVPKAPGPGRPPGADQGQGQGQGGQGQGQGHGQGHGQGQGQGRHQGPQQGQPAPYRPPSGAGQQGPYGSPSGQQGQGSYGAPGQYSPPAHEQQPAGYPQGQGYGRGQQAYGPPPGSHAPGYGQGQQTYGGQGPYAGTPDRPVYQGGATPSSAWPITNRSDPAARDSGGTATVVALATGVLLALDVCRVGVHRAPRDLRRLLQRQPSDHRRREVQRHPRHVLLIVAGLSSWSRWRCG